MYAYRHYDGSSRPASDVRTIQIIRDPIEIARFIESGAAQPALAQPIQTAYTSALDSFDKFASLVCGHGDVTFCATQRSTQLAPATTHYALSQLVKERRSTWQQAYALNSRPGTQACNHLVASIVSIIDSTKSQQTSAQIIDYFENEVRWKIFDESAVDEILRTAVVGADNSLKDWQAVARFLRTFDQGGAGEFSNLLQTAINSSINSSDARVCCGFTYSASARLATAHLAQQLRAVNDVAQVHITAHMGITAARQSAGHNGLVRFMTWCAAMQTRPGYSTPYNIDELISLEAMQDMNSFTGPSLQRMKEAVSNENFLHSARRGMAASDYGRFLPSKSESIDAYQQAAAELISAKSEISHMHKLGILVSMYHTFIEHNLAHVAVQPSTNGAFERHLPPYSGYLVLETTRFGNFLDQISSAYGTANVKSEVQSWARECMGQEPGELLMEIMLHPGLCDHIFTQIIQQQSSVRQSHVAAIFPAKVFMRTKFLAADMTSANLMQYLERAARHQLNDTTMFDAVASLQDDPSEPTSLCSDEIAASPSIEVFAARRNDQRKDSSGFRARSLEVYNTWWDSCFLPRFKSDEVCTPTCLRWARVHKAIATQPDFVQFLVCANAHQIRSEFARAMARIAPRLMTKTDFTLVTNAQASLCEDVLSYMHIVLPHVRPAHEVDMLLASALSVCQANLTKADTQLTNPSTTPARRLVVAGAHQRPAAPVAISANHPAVPAALQNQAAAANNSVAVLQDELKDIRDSIAKLAMQQHAPVSQNMRKLIDDKLKQEKEIAALKQTISTHNARSAAVSGASIKQKQLEQNLSAADALVKQKEAVIYALNQQIQAHNQPGGSNAVIDTLKDELLQAHEAYDNEVQTARDLREELHKAKVELRKTHTVWSKVVNSKIDLTAKSQKTIADLEKRLNDCIGDGAARRLMQKSEMIKMKKEKNAEIERLNDELKSTKAAETAMETLQNELDAKKEELAKAVKDGETTEAEKEKKMKELRMKHKKAQAEVQAKWNQALEKAESKAVKKVTAAHDAHVSSLNDQLKDALANNKAISEKLAALKTTHDEQAVLIQAEKEAMANLQSDHAQQLADLQLKHKRNPPLDQAAAAAAKKEIDDKHAEDVAALKLETENKLEAARETADAELKRIQGEHEDALSIAQSKFEIEASKAKRAEDAAEALRQRADEELIRTKDILDRHGLDMERAKAKRKELERTIKELQEQQGVVVDTHTEPGVATRKLLEDSIMKWKSKMAVKLASGQSTEEAKSELQKLESAAKIAADAAAATTHASTNDNDSSVSDKPLPDQQPGPDIASRLPTTGPMSRLVDNENEFCIFQHKQLANIMLVKHNALGSEEPLYHRVNVDAIRNRGEMTPMATVDAIVPMNMNENKLYDDSEFAKITRTVDVSFDVEDNKTKIATIGTESSSVLFVRHGTTRVVRAIKVESDGQSSTVFQFKNANSEKTPPECFIAPLIVYYAYAAQNSKSADGAIAMAITLTGSDLSPDEYAASKKSKATVEQRDVDKTSLKLKEPAPEKEDDVVAAPGEKVVLVHVCSDGVYEASATQTMVDIKAAKVYNKRRIFAVGTQRYYVAQNEHVVMRCSSSSGYAKVTDKTILGCAYNTHTRCTMTLLRRIENGEITLLHDMAQGTQDVHAKDLHIDLRDDSALFVSNSADVRWLSARLVEKKNNHERHLFYNTMQIKFRWLEHRQNFESLIGLKVASTGEQTPKWHMCLPVLDRANMQSEDLDQYTPLRGVYVDTDMTIFWPLAGAQQPIYEQHMTEVKADQSDYNVADTPTDRHNEGLTLSQYIDMRKAMAVPKQFEFVFIPLAELPEVYSELSTFTSIREKALDLYGLPGSSTIVVNPHSGIHAPDNPRGSLTVSDGAAFDKDAQLCRPIADLTNTITDKDSIDEAVLQKTHLLTAASTYGGGLYPLLAPDTICVTHADGDKLAFYALGDVIYLLTPKIATHMQVSDFVRHQAANSVILWIKNANAMHYPFPPIAVPRMDGDAYNDAVYAAMESFVVNEKQLIEIEFDFALRIPNIMTEQDENKYAKSTAVREDIAAFIGYSSGQPEPESYDYREYMVHEGVDLQVYADRFRNRLIKLIDRYDSIADAGAAWPYTVVTLMHNHASDTTYFEYTNCNVYNKKYMQSETCQAGAPYVRVSASDVGTLGARTLALDVNKTSVMVKLLKTKVASVPQLQTFMKAFYAEVLELYVNLEDDSQFRTDTAHGMVSVTNQNGQVTTAYAANGMQAAAVSAVDIIKRYQNIVLTSGKPASIPHTVQDVVETNQATSPNAERYGVLMPKDGAPSVVTIENGAIVHVEGRGDITFANVDDFLKADQHGATRVGTDVYMYTWEQGLGSDAMTTFRLVKELRILGLGSPMLFGPGTGGKDESQPDTNLRESIITTLEAGTGKMLQIIYYAAGSYVCPIRDFTNQASADASKLKVAKSGIRVTRHISGVGRRLKQPYTKQSASKTTEFQQSVSYRFGIQPNMQPEQFLFGRSGAHYNGEKAEDLEVATETFIKWNKHTNPSKEKGRIIVPSFKADDKMYACAVIMKPMDIAAIKGQEQWRIKKIYTSKAAAEDEVASLSRTFDIQEFMALCSELYLQGRGSDIDKSTWTTFAKSLGDSEEKVTTKVKDVLQAAANAYDNFSLDATKSFAAMLFQVMCLNNTDEHLFRPVLTATDRSATILSLASCANDNYEWFCIVFGDGDGKNKSRLQPVVKDYDKRSNSESDYPLFYNGDDSASVFASFGQHMHSLYETPHTAEVAGLLSECVLVLNKALRYYYYTDGREKQMLYGILDADEGCVVFRQISKYSIKDSNKLKYMQRKLIANDFENDADKKETQEDIDALTDKIGASTKEAEQYRVIDQTGTAKRVDAKRAIAYGRVYALPLGMSDKCSTATHNFVDEDLTTLNMTKKMANKLKAFTPHGVDIKGNCLVESFVSALNAVRGNEKGVDQTDSSWCATMIAQINSTVNTLADNNWDIVLTDKQDVKMDLTSLKRDDVHKIQTAEHVIVHIVAYLLNVNATITQEDDVKDSIVITQNTGKIKYADRVEDVKRIRVQQTDIQIVFTQAPGHANACMVFLPALPVTEPIDDADADSEDDTTPTGDQGAVEEDEVVAAKEGLTVSTVVAAVSSFFAQDAEDESQEQNVILEAKEVDAYHIYFVGGDVQTYYSWVPAAKGFLSFVVDPQLNKAKVVRMSASVPENSRKVSGKTQEEMEEMSAVDIQKLTRRTGVKQVGLGWGKTSGTWKNPKKDKKSMIAAIVKSDASLRAAAKSPEQMCTLSEQDFMRLSDTGNMTHHTLPLSITDSFDDEVKKWIDDEIAAIEQTANDGAELSDTTERELRVKAVIYEQAVTSVHLSSARQRMAEVARWFKNSAMDVATDTARMLRTNYIQDTVSKPQVYVGSGLGFIQDKVPQVYVEYIQDMARKMNVAKSNVSTFVNELKTEASKYLELETTQKWLALQEKMEKAAAAIMPSTSSAIMPSTSSGQATVAKPVIDRKAIVDAYVRVFRKLADENRLHDANRQDKLNSIAMEGIETNYADVDSLIDEALAKYNTPEAEQLPKVNKRASENVTLDDEFLLGFDPAQTSGKQDKNVPEATGTEAHFDMNLYTTFYWAEAHKEIYYMTTAPKGSKKPVEVAMVVYSTKTQNFSFPTKVKKLPVVDFIGMIESSAVRVLFDWEADKDRVPGDTTWMDEFEDGRKEATHNNQIVRPFKKAKGRDLLKALLAKGALAALTSESITKAKTVKKKKAKTTKKNNTKRFRVEDFYRKDSQ